MDCFAQAASVFFLESSVQLLENIWAGLVSVIAAAFLFVTLRSE